MVDLCRTCMENGTLKSIFLKEAKVMISSKIMCLAKINIYPGDGLPSTICSDCIIKLNRCYEFIQMCEVSDLKLRANLKLHVEKSSLSKSELICDEIVDDEADNEALKFEHDRDIYGEFDEDKKIIKEERSTSTLSIKNKSRKVNSEKKIEKQQCFTCGKVMSSKFRLKTHLRTHTGERPFSCPHCNKNFSLAQNLKVHIRTHTGEKPLQCTVCGDSFAQSAGFAAHKRKHTGQTPYKCVLCPRSFRTIGHLQYHIRRHTGEKNFECDTCSRAFITRSDLKQHILTHTGDKPHACTVCGLRLTRASHLKRHILLKHNGSNHIKEHIKICSECSMTFQNKIEYEKHRKQHPSDKIK